jgi:serine/threonine-protein kinase
VYSAETDAVLEPGLLAARLAPVGETCRKHDSTPEAGCWMMCGPGFRRSRYFPRRNTAASCYMANFETLAATFDRIAALPAAERHAALAALDVDDATRAELAALLAADAGDDDPLAAAIDAGARRLIADAPAPATTDQRIGPWRVLREIGAGGMGTVFLAERADGAYGQQVALKLLRGFPTEDGRRRLRQERQVLAQLDHPYIARLVDGGETDAGQPWLAMEYVDGLPVVAHAATQALGLAARVAVVDRIAEAVAHAHAHLVIHRDLKPGNVLVRADGTPKLLDFGVAKLVDLGATPDATSTRVWTPGYASPEQQAGRPVTTATDVYALGMLLHELLHGRRVDGTPSTPPLTPIAVDADLAGIVARARADDPGERYPTVEALRDDLARWRDGRPVRAARDTPWYRARKFVRRHRFGVAMVTAGLAASALFVWRLDVERERALAAEALAEQRRVAAEQAADTARGTLDFFSALLGDLAPANAGASALTVDDLLARAQARIDRELPTGSPQRAVLEAYVGQLWDVIGQSDRARDAMLPALESLATRGLDGNAMYAGLASSAANALFNVGDNAGAARWSRVAADAWRELASTGDDGGLARFYADVADGYAHYVSGAYAEAASAYERALARAVEVGADDAPRLRDDRANAAQVRVDSLLRLGRPQDALAAVDTALAETVAAGGQGSGGEQRLLLMRTSCLRELGRNGEALAAIERAVAAYRAMYGERGTVLANLENERGLVLNELGRYAEARAAFELAQQVNRAATGGIADPVTELNLAMVCDSLGDYACAVARSSAVIDDPVAQAAMLPTQRRDARLGHARALSQAGEYARAAAILDAEIAALRGETDASPVDLASASVHAARNALRAGDLHVATTHSTQARTLFASLVPTGHYVFLSLDRIDGEIALARGKLAAAAPLIEAFHDGTQAVESPDSIWAAYAGFALADLRHRQGRDDEARALLERWLPVARSVVLPTQRDRAAAEALAARLNTT